MNPVRSLPAAPQGPTPAVVAAAPDVSIVIPMYNEVENLPDLVARVGEAMAPSGFRFEMIAVDDGSTDGTAELLDALARDHAWLQPVILTRRTVPSCRTRSSFTWKFCAVALISSR